MLLWLYNYGPPEWTWPLILLAVVVVLHHLSQGRPVWLWVTGLVGSALAGWLAQTLGLGWFASTYFGSRLTAALVYVAVGLIWLTAEVGHDLVQNVIPRYLDFRAEWEQKRRPQGRRLIAAMKKKEFEAAVNAWNMEHPNDPVILLRRYQWSRSRRWWFLIWLLCWPVFAANFLLWAIRQSPWEWISWLLPLFVSGIKWIFVRGADQFTDDPGIHAPDPSAQDAGDAEAKADNLDNLDNLDLDTFERETEPSR